jgi:hypothetical protein
MKFRTIAACCLGAALLASCSMKQSVTLDKSGSATVRFNYLVSQQVAETMIGLMNLNGNAAAPAPKGLFDVEGIRKGFEKNKQVTVKSLSAPTNTSIKGELVYDNFEQAFGTGDAQKTGLVRFLKGNGKTTISLHFAKDTISQIASIFPQDQRAYVDIFAPPAVEGTEMNEADYLDMLKSLFGDSVVPEARKSSLELAFTPAGKIIEQKGGSVQGNTVTFTIPILKILVLEKPLDYSVTFLESTTP